jgi:hypothetical protein
MLEMIRQEDALYKRLRMVEDRKMLRQRGKEAKDEKPVKRVK